MDKTWNLEDPQELTEHSLENLKDLLGDISSSLSTDRPITREELLDILKCLINDLQVEVYTLENSDPE